jgi:hypothetical protein
MMWWIPQAWAAAPVTYVEEAGVVRASVVVPVALDVVVPYLRNPHETVKLSHDGQFTVKDRPDGCWDYAFEANYGWIGVSYEALSCPTATGQDAKMVKSESFTEMAFQWSARTVPTGTEVTYTYKAVSTLPVPAWMMRRSTKSSIVGVMERFAARY